MSEASYETIRPLLVSVDGDDVVRVALEHRAELFVAELPAKREDPEARARAAAGATAEALGQLTPSAVSFELDWCGLVETGSELPTLAVVLVGVNVAGAQMRYAGAAVVNGAADMAAAKAVLDALNRRLGVTGL